MSSLLHMPHLCAKAVSADVSPHLHQQMKMNLIGSSIRQAYGGVKDSGSGREGVRWAMKDYTEERTLMLSGLGIFS